MISVITHLPDSYHGWAESIAPSVVNENLLLHSLLHLVFVTFPIFMFFGFLIALFFYVRSKLKISIDKNYSDVYLSGVMPYRLLDFIYKYSLKSQIFLIAASLLLLPLTYYSFELPKRIINDAIEINSTKGQLLDYSERIDSLLYLCSLFLLIIISITLIKFIINYYKGFVSEKIIKLIRLKVYNKIQHKDKWQKDVVPVISQEVEPVGGFSGVSFSSPMLYGGTAVTIIFFMLSQNFILGVFAVALLPLQIVIIPRFQRKINKLVRERVITTRKLSGLIQHSEIGESTASLKSIDQLQDLRLEIFKNKFMMKSINNFIMNMVPFGFYVVGGYFVIAGSLSMGALIASLASYKDLSSSIRELFIYYQNLQDVTVRYKEIYDYLRG